VGVRIVVTQGNLKIGIGNIKALKGRDEIDSQAKLKQSLYSCTRGGEGKMRYWENLR